MEERIVLVADMQQHLDKILEFIVSSVNSNHSCVLLISLVGQHNACAAEDNLRPHTHFLQESQIVASSHDKN